jgi:hypothetical protein
MGGTYDTLLFFIDSRGVQCTILTVIDKIYVIVFCKGNGLICTDYYVVVYTDIYFIQSSATSC